MKKPLSSMEDKSSLGLVLSGGGARGAYQAGVVMGLYEIAKNVGVNRPFKILTGVSSGAINISFLAANANDPQAAARDLANMWSNIRSEDVYRTDLASLSTIGWGWIHDIATGHAQNRDVPQSLLVTDPLSDLLNSKIKFSGIAENMRNGIIDSVAVSALNYATSEVNTFFQTRGGVVPWTRIERLSHEVVLAADHVMASSAIPLFFPPVKLDDGYYGDGSLRNLAPISPALHLGSGRIIAVGVQSDIRADGRRSNLWAKGRGLRSTPSVARILSVIINGVMMDATAADLERLKRINHTVSLLLPTALNESGLRQIPFLYLNPTVDLAKIAEEEDQALPKTIRFLLRGLGPKDEGADLLSYLLFEPAYSRRLVELGYKDAMVRSGEIGDFMAN